MSFFTYFYLENKMYFHDYLKYIVIFVTLGTLLLASTLYLRHRIESKYRDLSIISLLLIILLLGIQYTQYEQNQIYANDSSRIITFLNSVRDNQQLKNEDLIVNDQKLTTGMKSYSFLAIKLTIGIIGLILQINLMGKGNLAPTSAMDQVQNYVLGGIIGAVIYNDNIGILQFILVLILWTLLVFTLRFIKNYNRFVKNIIDGKPVWVILNGKVQIDECMKNGISAHDLMFKLRAAGIYEIATVKRAVIEQNGQISIIQYGDEDLRYPLIIDGQIDSDILELLNRDEDWVKQELEKNQLTVEQVYIGEYLNGKLIPHLYKQS